VSGVSDVKLHGGSFSQSAVIKLSSELVLLIVCVSASLGQLGALSLMMVHNSWDSWTEFACVSRESSAKLVVDVCGWEGLRHAGCCLVGIIIFA
jgi:hypothetical protein